MATQAEKIEAVKQFADAHYDQEGWDYVIESWDDEFFIEIFEKHAAKTSRDAIVAVAEVVYRLGGDDLRDEASNTSVRFNTAKGTAVSLDADGHITAGGRSYKLLSARVTEHGYSIIANGDVVIPVPAEARDAVQTVADGLLEAALAEAAPHIAADRAYDNATRRIQRGY